MSKTVRVFLSQPMRGFIDEEIINRRNKDIEQLKKHFGDKPFELIDTLFKEEATAKHKGVEYLARSIAEMANADYIAMDSYSRLHRGCLIEHRIAEEYGIKIIYLV